MSLFSALYMLQNVLIVKFLQTCKLYIYMSFFSALYMLWNVLIVNILCNLYIYSKNKNDLYFGMGKNTKVMPQMPHYLSFLLGKGGILMPQTL